MRTGAVELPLHGGRFHSERYGVPLHNYLLQLVEDNDKKEASLYLNNVGWLVEELWLGLIRKCNNVRKRREAIAKYLGIHPSTIYGYKNNRKSISINMLYDLLLLWKKYCNKTNSEVKNKWQQLYERDDWRLSTHSKHQKTKLPKYITPKLAYFMGWMVGDGHLKEAHNYVVKISEKSVDQLKLIIRPLFKELFDIKVPIFRRYMGGYAVQVGSKPVYRFIKNVLGLKVGKIPKIVWGFNKENKKHFLMGIVDSEGYVNSKYKYRQVVISQANYGFLLGIQKLFIDVGFVFRGPYKHSTKLGTWYTIRLEKKSNELLRFCSEVGSYHVDKSKKLKILVNEIEENRRH